MKARIIESMEQWEILKAAIIEHEFRLFQMQFSYDSPEGFHAWFLKDDKQVEVITHNKAIQKDIVSRGMS